MFVFPSSIAYKLTKVTSLPPPSHPIEEVFFWEGAGEALSSCMDLYTCRWKWNHHVNPQDVLERPTYGSLSGGFYYRDRHVFESFTKLTSDSSFNFAPQLGYPGKIAG